MLNNNLSTLKTDWMFALIQIQCQTSQPDVAYNLNNSINSIICVTINIESTWYVVLTVSATCLIILNNNNNYITTQESLSRQQNYNIVRNICLNNLVNITWCHCGAPLSVIVKDNSLVL